MRDLRVRLPAPCDEKWETMTPVGHHRACAKCDRVIHDLTHYAVSEIETLLRDDPDICVRARIDASGAIATAPRRNGSMRRMMAAVGASAGMLISQPAAALDRHGEGAIVGRITTYAGEAKIIATDANGRSFRSKAHANGRYRIKNLPAGTYTLEFHPDCGESWKIEHIVLDKEDVFVPDDPRHEGGCIIVGKLEIDDYNG